MSERIKPILGAYVTLSTLYLVGVLFFFGPIAARDEPGAPLVPGLVGLVVSTALHMALFVWVSREMGAPLKAALAIALAQLLLVDVDYVLSGTRGIETAAASAVLLLVSWTLTGLVYGQLDRARAARSEPPAPTSPEARGLPPMSAPTPSDQDVRPPEPNAGNP